MTLTDEHLEPHGGNPAGDPAPEPLPAARRRARPPRDKVTAPPIPRKRRSLNPQQRYLILVGLAVLAAFGVRLVLALHNDVMTNDASVYLSSGESIWAGDGFDRNSQPELHFPPFYPFVLGGVETVVGDPHTTVVLVTLLAGTALVLPIASIARLAGGDRAGIAAAWIAALATGLSDTVVTSGSGNEAVYLLLVLMGFRLVLALHRWRIPARLAGAAAVGVLTGLAYLTRPEGVFFAGPFALVVVAPWVRARLAARRQRTVPNPPTLAATLATLAALGLGILVCVAPYASFLHDHTGRWELTAKTRDASIDTWRAVAERDREARDAVLYQLDETGLAFTPARATLASLALHDPVGYLQIVGVNVAELGKQLGDPVDREHPSLGWELLPLPVTALALWGTWRRRRNPVVLATAACALLPLATALAFFVQSRYLIPLTGFLAILAGVGFAALPRHWSRRATGAIGVLLALSLVAASDGAEGWLERREPTEHRIVGEWLATNTPSDARVMTRSLITVYYAERPAVAMPHSDVDTMLAYAQAWGVDYLVFDEYNMRSLRPDFADLADGFRHEGLQPVHAFTHTEREVWVYDLDPPATENPPGFPTPGFMGDQ